MHAQLIKNKKVAVVGLGVEGKSTVAYLLRHGVSPTVLDEKLHEGSEEAKWLREQGIAYYFGKDALAHVLDEKEEGKVTFDIVFRSPGISSHRPELEEAKRKGVEISSQVKFFMDVCPCPVIGVTGTKGKGTTSSLLYEMLKKQRDSVYLGGNIGNPPLDFLDELQADSTVVLELSSFQLLDLDKSPHIAVMLMITSEHLDYHKDTAEYIDAKRNILRFQTQNDYAVINRDYIASNESDIHTNGQVYQVSVERICERGCYIKDKKVCLSDKGEEREIIAIDKILLPGKHNLENVCAAVMAASLAGVAKEHMVSVLKTFKGLEHRLQLISELNGVKYYDDSFSTTPETAIAAIEAFTSPEILILGGSSKQSDFSELGRVIRLAKNIKAIIGIGDEWERIKEEIGTLNQDAEILLVEGASNMTQIVQAASRLAQPGDVVLLTPACASFGMFKNYKDRGEQFVTEVTKLG